MRRIAVLDAPSNLGLRPPTATSVPGCAKAPGALRDHGVVSRLGARDAGCLTPPRYDPGDWRPGDGVAQAPEIAAYSRALADRIGAIIDGGEFPVILGGDCSILIGSGLAMHRLGEAVGGRIGLVFVDGHSDFRHPGNASYVGAAAGEDLALVTGRGQADLAGIERRRPYFRDVDVVVLGIRAQDEYRLDLQAAGIVTRPVPALRAEGAARSAQWARDQLVDCAGYWVHIDVDVLDPAVMPAVDAPDPGGIAFPELELLLAGLVESPHCLGVEITVFDPDYDPDGRYAAEITSAVVAGLAPVKATSPRPDLVAARRDLANPLKVSPVLNGTTDPVVASAAGIEEPVTVPDQVSAEVPAPDPAEPEPEAEPEFEPEPEAELPEEAVEASASTFETEETEKPENPEDFEAAEPEPDAAPEEVEPEDSQAEAVVIQEHEPEENAEVRLAPLLGSAPLLDSEPLPATRPGMLRPRPSLDPPAAETLQRPSFPGPSFPGLGLPGGDLP
ncbi:arginase [Actinoplanes lutulentus]|uniref:Arginase n=1 Tax=Actinoplanes lutulentus TaxID=1287878 RepID=A0A327Z0E3_9ACTN|nr:arginase family protein [Actinoplanes lutulentus]MBB2942081.1 arginase [Actinoplanes lutulentus]RAK26965.1 arginase [Actinoplanes lutulentus]